MRKSLLAGGLAAASLTLAACGGGGGTPATLTSLLTTAGSTSDIQLHLTASGTGLGPVKDEQLAKQFSVDVDVSNPGGGSASATGAKDDVEVKVNVGTTPFVDLRVVGSNLYVRLDLTALDVVPGVKPAELQVAQAFLGGKWFVVPESVLKGSLPKVTAADEAKALADRAKVSELAAAFVAALAANHHTALSGGGYEGTGTLESIDNAILPALRGFDPHLKAPGAQAGTYAYTVTASGSTMTGLTVSVTAPNTSTGKDATGTLAVTIGHAAETIAAPSGATPFPTALLQEFAGSLDHVQHVAVSSAHTVSVAVASR